MPSKNVEQVLWKNIAWRPKSRENSIKVVRHGQPTESMEHASVKGKHVANSGKICWCLFIQRVLKSRTVRCRHWARKELLIWLVIAFRVYGPRRRNLFSDSYYYELVAEICRFELIGQASVQVQKSGLLWCFHTRTHTLHCKPTFRHHKW